MMYKIISIDPFVQDTDELSIRLISNSFDKSASILGRHIPDEIIACVKGLKSDPEFVYAHVIALSTDDRWGSNRNGDTFKESDLLGVQDEVEASKNPEPYTGVKLPRYKTFLSAKVYKHHQNKDPNNSFGDVICAAFNSDMHRVELVLRVSIKKDPEFFSELETGKPISLSMGCKVPFDTCSICQHKAKSRAEYCEHAKTMMNQILEDGRQVKVYNEKPRFHDLSRVLIGADETAVVLKKVASILGMPEFDPNEYYEDEDMETLATAFKGAEIDKKVPGTTIGDAVKNVNSKLMSEVSKSEPDIRPEDLDAAAEHPYGDILSTLTNMGMVLKPSEHRRIIIIKITKNPDFLKESSAIDVDFQSKPIYNIFKKYAADRSCYTDYLVKRAALSNDRHEQEVETDPVSESLYNIYRRELLKLDAEKVASHVERNFNIDNLLKEAVHWTVPTAAVPLAAAYMYGAHQDYKRRYKGEPITKFQEAMADKPGKIGAGGALAALLARGLLKGKRITIK